MKRSTLSVFVALLLFGFASNAGALLIDLGPGSFTPGASEITFDEIALGTVNPVYNFLGVSGIGDISVSFGGHFLGQTATAGVPVSLSGSPTGPLTLDPTAPTTFTINDGAPGATSPVLSGNPTFNGPISVLFSAPVAGVGLKGGYFDAIGATTIEAFDAVGNSLGSITNSVTEWEFYGLADASGANVISGISFYITGNEPAGFEIDNLTFGAADVINPVPEPATMLLFVTGLLGLGIAGRKKLHKK